MAISDGPRQRTKHIDVRAKWLTDRVGKKVIQLKHIPGTEQVADILTKLLQKTRFKTIRELLLNFSLSLSISSICLTVSNSGAYLSHESAPVFYKPSMVRYMQGTSFQDVTVFVAEPCKPYFSNLLQDSQLNARLAHECEDRFVKLSRSLLSCHMVHKVNFPLHDADFFDVSHAGGSAALRVSPEPPTAPVLWRKTEQ